MDVARYMDVSGLSKTSVYRNSRDGLIVMIGNGQAIMPYSSPLYEETVSKFNEDEFSAALYRGTEAELCRHKDGAEEELMRNRSGTDSNDEGSKRPTRKPQELTVRGTEAALKRNCSGTYVALSRNCAGTGAISATDTRLEVVSSLLSLQPKNTTVRDIVAKWDVIEPYLAKLAIPDKKAVDRASSAGYVRLYRKLLHNGVFENPGVMKMMVALLLSANHERKCLVCGDLLRVGGTEDEFRTASIMLAVLELEYGVIRLYRKDAELMCEIVKWRNYQSQGSTGRSVFRDMRNLEIVIRSMNENEDESLACAPDTTRNKEKDKKKKNSLMGMQRKKKRKRKFRAPMTISSVKSKTITMSRLNIGYPHTIQSHSMSQTSLKRQGNKKERKSLGTIRGGKRDISKTHYLIINIITAKVPPKDTNHPHRLACPL